jgi:hypothetical protein
MVALVSKNGHDVAAGRPTGQAVDLRSLSSWVSPGGGFPPVRDRTDGRSWPVARARGSLDAARAGEIVRLLDGHH